MTHGGLRRIRTQSSGVAMDFVGPTKLSTFWMLGSPEAKSTPTNTPSAVGP
jgi:hypothetical protein